MLDLAIAYRIYPGVSKTPAAWANDKFELSAFCLRSFKEALGSLRIKMWVLLDGCPPAYEDLFRHYFGEDELVIMKLDNIGNVQTFSMQLDLLARQTEADLVYFAEDDYFYFPDALVEMVEFARNNEAVDFVTPYDHSGNYDLPLHHERHWIKPFGRRHWRTCTATCLTFLARRKSLLRTRALFETYGRHNPDGSIWMAITQKWGLLNFRVYARNLMMFKLWINAWFWGSRQIIFGGSHRLWGPIPSLATHLESTCLAPLIHWEAEFRRAERDPAVHHEDLRPFSFVEPGDGAV